MGGPRDGRDDAEGGEGGRAERAGLDRAVAMQVGPCASNCCSDGCGFGDHTAMTSQVCTKCGQGWVKLKAAEPDICPTCRKGLAPLSTLRGGEPEKVEGKALTHRP